MLYFTDFKTVYSILEYTLNYLHVNAYLILYEYQYY